MTNLTSMTVNKVGRSDASGLKVLVGLSGRMPKNNIEWTTERRMSFGETVRNPRPEPGTKFGKWTVEDKPAIFKKSEKHRGYECRIPCRCECGKESNLLYSTLSQGRSSGCNKCRPHMGAKHSLEHGGSNTKLYRLWCGIRTRCTKPDHVSARHYLHKGITVCDDWMSFLKFREWALANGFVEGLSIDRLDPKQGYFPENCEWVSRSENSRRSAVYTANERARIIGENTALKARVEELERMLKLK